MQNALLYSQERKGPEKYQACRVKPSKTAEISTQAAIIGFGLQAQVSVSKDTVKCQRSNVSCKGCMIK